MKVLLKLCIWMASTRLIYDGSSMLSTHPPHVLGFCSMCFVLSCDGFPQYSIMNGCVEQTSLWMCLYSFHFREVYLKCIEYIGKFLIQIREISKFG